MPVKNGISSAVSTADHSRSEGSTTSVSPLTSVSSLLALSVKDTLTLIVSPSSASTSV